MFRQLVNRRATHKRRTGFDQRSGFAANDLEGAALICLVGSIRFGRFGFRPPDIPRKTRATSPHDASSLGRKWITLPEVKDMDIVRSSSSVTWWRVFIDYQSIKLARDWQMADRLLSAMIHHHRDRRQQPYAHKVCGVSSGQRCARVRQASQWVGRYECSKSTAKREFAI
jgi:hypothetical protein